MAKYGVTYSCGHTGTVQLFGKHTERERKLAWYAAEAKCPECYKSANRAEADAAGPQVHVRYLAAYDPAQVAENYEARAIRASIDVDALDEVDAQDRPWNWETTRKAAVRKAADFSDLAKHARSRPATEAAYEITIINSYQVREVLKARGYRFVREAESKDLLGMWTVAGWVKRCATQAEAQAELVECCKAGWTTEGRSEPTDRIVDALALGRLDVLNGSAGQDTVASATAAREAARVARAEARKAATERVVATAEQEAKLATFKVGDHPGSVRIVPPGERTEARPYDLCIRARDGRTAWGWASDDGWFVSAVERSGQLVKLTAISAEADRIIADARKMYNAEQGA